MPSKSFKPDESVLPAKTPDAKVLPVNASSARTKTATSNRTAATSNPASRPDESLETADLQAKRKTTPGAKKIVANATVARDSGSQARAPVTKVAAKAVATARKTSDPVPSNPPAAKAAVATAGKKKTLATETGSKETTSTKATVAPVAADQKTRNDTRGVTTRDNRAKGNVAKENSAKSAATRSVVDETSAVKGEVRSNPKSVSGVKTSAAAFFAARQRMTPVKAPVRTLDAKVVDQTVAAGPIVAKPLVAKPVETAPLGTSPETSVSDGAKGFSPVIEAHKATGEIATASGVVTSGVMTSGALKPAAKAPLPKGQGFKTLEYIVYPAHGVGQITAIEEQEVAGYKLELFVISFVKDKMILKVPLPKIASVGMRKLAEAPVVKRALDTLTGRARIKRTMWSRRAQEYEAKINSGDLVAIAEVVRDLYRSDAQPEQSYSERQLYEAALDRMAREIAVVQKLSDAEALKLIDEQLQKGPRRTKVEETEADETDEGDEGKIVEAA